MYMFVPNCIALAQPVWTLSWFQQKNKRADIVSSSRTRRTLNINVGVLNECFDFQCYIRNFKSIFYGGWKIWCYFYYVGSNFNYSAKIIDFVLNLSLIWLLFIVYQVILFLQVLNKSSKSSSLFFNKNFQSMLIPINCIPVAHKNNSLKICSFNVLNNILTIDN